MAANAFPVKDMCEYVMSRNASGMLVNYVLYVSSLYWTLLCDHSKRQIVLEPCQITAEVEDFQC
jgi:hypothetical protein